MNRYRLHLVTRTTVVLTTDIDVLQQVQRLDGSWIDAGDLGLINPTHVTRIEPLS